MSNLLIWANRPAAGYFNFQSPHHSRKCVPHDHAFLWKSPIAYIYTILFEWSQCHEYLPLNEEQQEQYGKFKVKITTTRPDGVLELRGLEIQRNEVQTNKGCTYMLCFLFWLKQLMFLPAWEIFFRLHTLLLSCTHFAIFLFHKYHFSFSQQ